jgi:threonine/homoserine/homoserine lactone efflux protein
MSALPHDDRSLGQLFSELMNETRTLVRQEIALAKTEVKENAAFAGKNAGIAAAGGAIVLVGLLPVIAGIVISLGHKIGYATSAFLVGALVLAAGAVLLMKGIKALKARSLAPQQTTAQVKETKEWARHQIRR